MANFLERLQTFLFGAAIGRAASDAVTPVLEPVRQRAWEQNQNRVLDPGTAAEAVARRFIEEGEGQFDAARGGVAKSRFGALIRLAQRYPGTGEAKQMANRKLLAPDDVRALLGHHGIPEKYTEQVIALFAELLTPGELAAAIHRGLVKAPDGLLLGEQPSGPRNVESYPVYPIPALEEAAGSGYDRDRLGVLVGLQGLPMGTHEAAQAYFRGILTRGDYIAAFNESNSRNEWAQAVLDYTRQIPTARDFLENALRGYRTQAEAIAGAALHGMSAEHATLIYQNQGRPMTVRLITQALARGGVFKPEPGEITDPYDASIVEGNLKPAYYDLAKALRYTMPTPFAIRQLVEAGDWTAAKGAERLKWLGWYPPDAEEVAKAWAGGSSAAGGKQETAATLRAEYEGYLLSEPELRSALAALGFDAGEVDREVHLGDAARVKGYRDKALEAAHKSYVSAQITSGDVKNYLAQLRIDAGAVDDLVGIWDLEKLVTRKTLTAAQIRAAYRRGAITQAEAVADLEEHGYSAADASTYLAS